MIPGLLSWLTLILMFLLSWLTPIAAAIFIILFDIYWLFKTIYLSVHLRSSFSKMKSNLKTNWQEKLKNLKWENIYHLVILPMHSEPYGVIRETFESLKNNNYPKNRFILALATEERAGEESKQIAQKIKSEYENYFFKLIVTNHPKDLPDEIPGKGSNESWAAQEVKQSAIDPLKIPHENILVSVFDIDTQIFPDYFGCLTYNFLTCEHPQRSSFQPIPFFMNNIYQAPALARVVSFSATFWHLMQQSRPERLTTFSSHSMPFKALVEIGYWHRNIVSEDSRIFWQCYLHYNGDWRVVPLLYPISMDANVAPTFSKTLLNTYKQQRRWAYGAENIPYLLSGFSKKNIPLKAKLFWAFNQIEGMHSWATNSLIIFALGWLPILLGGESFNYTLLSHNLPMITHRIMLAASAGIVTSAILSVILLPKKPNWFKPYHYLGYFLQWILMPATLIIFGSIPALEAQTRLMLGGKFRLGFWVTPKGRY
ncbi:MAG: glycosyltransferase family 2 protein [Patescibacteria group bacterium]